MMPGHTSSYDISPHAGEAGFDNFILACSNLGDERTRVRRQWTRMTPTLAAIDGFIGYFCDASSPSNERDPSFGLMPIAHAGWRPFAFLTSASRRCRGISVSTSALLMGRSAKPGA